MAQAAAAEEKVTDAEAQLTTEKDQHRRTTKEWQGKHSEATVTHDESLRNLASQHDEEMQRVREEHHQKSTLARSLVAEKDAILKRITKEVEELRDEVESGGHSERKIIELAQQQASLA